MAELDDLIPIFGQTWPTTTGPLISVTVLFAKLAKGQYGRSIFEQLHSDENFKIMHIHLRFFIRLDLSIGNNLCYGGSRSLDYLHLSRAQVSYLPYAPKL